MKLLAFAASNSKKSINGLLINYAVSILDDVDAEILDLNDFEMPLFSVDREMEWGIPELAHRFYDKIGEADALLVSHAEHNGSYTVAFKNLYDWISRIDSKVYQGKPLILLATSPGGRGASGVLAAAVKSAPHYGGDLKASLSIPSFYGNFDTKAGKVSNPEIQSMLETTLACLFEIKRPDPTPG
ncbi:MAG: NAD(P)H-dependent oxidoreductase [Xanthomonadales bacterium]|nr:NAD(P)H-dependent oxidoreductase [Xanthomonadales bacterium]